MEIAATVDRMVEDHAVALLRAACVDVRAQETGNVSEAVRLEAERLGCSQRSLWKALRLAAEHADTSARVQHLRNALAAQIN